MTWHYVVARERFTNVDGTTQDVYSIREFFTESAHGGGIGWTEDAIDPAGETMIDLVHCLERMLKDATSRQVLDLTLDPPALVDRDAL